jgi:hypothetical protein
MQCGPVGLRGSQHEPGLTCAWTGGGTLPDGITGAVMQTVQPQQQTALVSRGRSALWNERRSADSFGGGEECEYAMPCSWSSRHTSRT